MIDPSKTAGVLPDVIAHGLDIVFCGTAAGAVSARRGAYYAGPGNAFWPTLFEVGLIPSALHAHEYAEAMQYKIGFTDLAKSVSGSDHELAKHHFDTQRLHTLVAAYQPKFLAFTGKRAAHEFVGHPVAYGLLPQRIGGTRLFVLPSPSGAARRYWNRQHWHELSCLRGSAGEAGRHLLAASSIAPRTMRL